MPRTGRGAVKWGSCDWHVKQEYVPFGCYLSCVIA